MSTSISATTVHVGSHVMIHVSSNLCVNTKKWYREEADLWAELGDEYHSARKNLL
jgi:hypothetical protein